MVKRIALILAGVLLAFLEPRPVLSAVPQAIGNAHKLCDTNVARVEAVRGIPQYLLKSISLAETGRWDKVRQANVAWPWTVTALGRGNYFPTKESALEFVRYLQANAIFNIDVGCMQVNLYYHGGAFDSLEQAIDPASNVAYAADYLERLYKSSRSWTTAAGHYHSMTPKRSQYYKMKVLKYWNKERSQAAYVDRKEIDHSRMNKLNATYKDRNRELMRFDHKDVRGSQLAAWKNNSPAGHDMPTSAAMRRAKKDAQWREKYVDGGLGQGGEAFAQKRREQLDKWRLTRAKTTNG